MATPDGEFGMTTMTSSDSSEEESKPSDNQASSSSEAIGVDTEVETTSQTPFTDTDFDIQEFLTDWDINTFLLVLLIIIKIGEYKK